MFIAEIIVMLLPARTDTKYFHEYILPYAEIRFVKGRLKFLDENNQAKDAAPFPSMVCVYRRQEEPCKICSFFTGIV